MAKRHTTRGDAEHTVKLRVVSPFIHRGVRVLMGALIDCNADEAQGAIFHGWAVPLINGGTGTTDAGRHNRRDMRAKP